MRSFAASIFWLASRLTFADSSRRRSTSACRRAVCAADAPSADARPCSWNGGGTLPSASVRGPSLLRDAAVLSSARRALASSRLRRTCARSSRCAAALSWTSRSLLVVRAVCSTASGDSTAVDSCKWSTLLSTECCCWDFSSGPHCLSRDASAASTCSSSFPEAGSSDVLQMDRHILGWRFCRAPSASLWSKAPSSPPKPMDATESFSPGRSRVTQVW
mmetsp:Transcript_8798/g.23412  ORF Transcript_8798/g.23412 Transcript_8798/m.23412 type:complete len:218 (-) Transcript_8798:443-1096(-)